MKIIAVEPQEDWPHKILVFLFQHYTAFNVPMNTFLQNDVLVGRTEYAGNLGRKIVRTLDELKLQNLLTWEPTDMKIEAVTLNPDLNDNISVTLAVVMFHARLTFDGLKYVENYLRLKGQDIIRRQNKVITWLSVGITFLTMVFIAVSAIISISTDRQLHRINKQFRMQRISIDSIKQYQKSMSHSMDSVSLHLPKMK
jgi:hypothetical protein